eukprot:comp12574_c0_seq1/m.7578 comp12574_c0_seq1/g.7578  ORF comp12574_c0_seq1/g.7578 comp12574_c0_seq1/m.7578 type:complete len:260 (-) comp12574_c0_seq1:465-1244(-)
MRLAVISALFGTACANVPLFMWSSHSVFSPEGLDRHNVHLQHLEQILQDASQKPKAMVLFLQNQFSTVDFARYGGKDGANFANLKSVVTTYPSVALSEVRDGGRRVEALFSRLGAGNTVTVKDSTDVPTLSLGSQPQVVVVPLQSDSNEETLKKNDVLVDAVTKRIAQLTGGNFVAAWTAKMPSPINVDMSFDHHLKRRDATNADPGKYQNRYLTPVVLSVLIVLFTFIVILVPGVYFTMEIQGPHRFQDPNIPMVGKD